MMTSSEASDITKSYELHPNSYITKPMQIEKFVTLVTSVNDFWLTHSKGPSRRNAATLSS
jgi:hypothetical protein